MIESKADSQKKLTIHTCTGPATTEEISTHIKEFYASQPTPNNLWNLERADLSGLSGNDVMNIARLTKEHRPDGLFGKTAIVAPQDLGYGIGRMFETFTELAGHQADLRVFRSLEAARAWMDA